MEATDAMAKAARLGSERNRESLRTDAWLGKETRKSDIGLAGKSGSAWMERKRLRPGTDQVKRRAPTDPPTAEPTGRKERCLHRTNRLAGPDAGASAGRHSRTFGNGETPVNATGASEVGSDAGLICCAGFAARSASFLVIAPPIHPPSTIHLPSSTRLEFTGKLLRSPGLRLDFAPSRASPSTSRPPLMFCRIT